MSVIGALPGVAAAQVLQASPPLMPVNRDGTDANNKSDPSLDQAKQAPAVTQHTLDVEV